MANSDNKKNVQIYPSKKRVVTNDKLSKVLFNLTDADYQYLVENQDTISFVEMKHHKKFGEIVSPLKIDIDGESFSINLIVLFFQFVSVNGLLTIKFLPLPLFFVV